MGRGKDSTAYKNWQRFVQQRIDRLNDVIHGEDEDDARRYKREWIDWMMLRAIMKRDTASDHEVYVDACREVQALEEL